MKDVLGGEALEVDKKQQNSGGLPGYEALSPEEQNKKLQKMFREVFGTKHGRIVLTVILEDLYYFDQCNNDEARALANYAKALIGRRLGLNDNKRNIDCILDNQ